MRISQKMTCVLLKCMVSIKTALVREALEKVHNIKKCYKNRFTQCKILVLMVLIIEACKVIHLLQNHLKNRNPFLFHVFDYTLAHKHP